MGLQIILDVAEASERELVALHVLIVSLRGLAPDATVISGGTLDTAPIDFPPPPPELDSPTGTFAGAPIYHVPPPGETAPFPVLEATIPTTGGETVPIAPPPPPPASSTAPAASPVSGPALLDSAGTPWDARIHSESKATVTGGTWRKRRNLPAGEYERVMAEIGHTPATAAPPPPPPAATASAPPPPATGAPAAPAAPPAPTAAGGNPIADFIGRITKLGHSYDVLNATAKLVGVDKFADVTKRPDLHEMFADMLPAGVTTDG